MSSNPSDPGLKNRNHFSTTAWSVVLAAGSTDKATALRALEGLARSYWYPLYAFARRDGHSPADAEDLAQSFFAFLLEKQTLTRARKECGRFRTFLLTCFRNHIGQVRRREATQKRGGDVCLIPLDAPSAEEKYALEPVEARTPEQLYEWRWAMTILEASLDRLREEYAEKGRLKLWERLHARLEDDGGPTSSYAQLGQTLGMSEAAVKTTVSRMRARLRELVRIELSRLVANAAELESEFYHWLRVLTNG